MCVQTKGAVELRQQKKQPGSPKKGLPGRFAYCIIKLPKITQKAG